MLIYIVFAVILVSCGPREIGYAVMVWPSDDSSVQTGSVYPVIEESDINGTFVILLDDDRREETDSWRVEFFRERDAADRYARRLEPWADSWARSLRTALPVREKADRTSASIYRLADGEVVKILSRPDETSDEAGLVDYWYEVLTRDGTRGWVYGYHLEQTTASGRAIAPVEDQGETDRLVRDIASIVWRPDYYRPMIDSGVIDLNDFGPQYGLSGSIEDSYFLLILPEFQRRFEYTGYFSPVNNTVEFEGTSLILTLRNDDELVAQYRLNDRERTTVFRRIEDDIAEVVAVERARRRQLLEQILQRGNTLISTAFGTMSISEDGSVLWEGFERLVPDILPRTFTGSGRIEFSLYPADEIRARYDGALRIRGSDGMIANFLYAITSEGIRLVYIPQNLIRDRIIVDEEPRSPVVMFYRFSRS